MKLFPANLQTSLLFAARYTHNRETAGTFIIVNALKQCWDQIGEPVQTQILKESHEALFNQNDWEDLRQFVEKRKSS